jgi:gamma-glutamylcyclotransferase (GGCT)/AIG2-like uncharacterized protein YtfP
MKSSSQPGPIQVFVYGTLMRGEARHGIIREHGVESVLLADTPGRLLDLGDYPALVPGAGPGEFVRGELVHCRNHEELIRRLDEIEGFRGEGQKDNLFERKVVPVGMLDGHVREAWAYMCARRVPDAGPIPSGDWREHRGVRRAFLEALVGGHVASDERALALKLVLNGPLLPDDTDAAVRKLLPLAATIERGDLSERELAMASGRWAVDVETAAGS